MLIHHWLRKKAVCCAFKHSDESDFACNLSIALTTVKGFRKDRYNLTLFKLIFNLYCKNKVLSVLGKFIYAFGL